MNLSIRSACYLLNRFVLKKPFLVAKDLNYGLAFRFKTEDAVGRSIYKKGIYEADITAFLNAAVTLQANDIVLDIGANIGWYTVFLAKRFSVQVHAFEPDKLNGALLEENIKHNHISKAVVIKKALSDHQGEAYLYRYKSSNLGRHSLLPLKENTDIKERVELITLDDYIAKTGLNVNNVRLVKMDIEGYEPVALSGGKALLGKVPLIIAEYSPSSMMSLIYVKYYCLLLEKAGYRPFKLKHNMLQALDVSELKSIYHPTVNIFWLLNKTDTPIVKAAFIR